MVAVSSTLYPKDTRGGLGERRLKLAPYADTGMQYQFRATVAKSGIVPSEPRYMLVEIHCAETGKRLAEHCWVKDDRIVKAGVVPGDTILFHAKVYCYQRSNGSTTYGLTSLRNIVVVDNPDLNLNCLPREVRKYVLKKQQEAQRVA